MPACAGMTDRLLLDSQNIEQPEFAAAVRKLETQNS
jgi:hypothetical protein